MAKEKTTEESEALVLRLTFSKETKGTYVYTMSHGDVDIGGIYLQKLLFKKKPGERLAMRIVEAE